MLETNASFFFARLATALRPLRLKIFSGTHRAPSWPQETPSPLSKSQSHARFPPIGHVDRQFSTARWHRRCQPLQYAHCASKPFSRSFDAHSVEPEPQLGAFSDFRTAAWVSPSGG